jgi:histidyl-tRNA synthetase
LKAVRAAGINAEMYPKRGKIQRQMQYANDKNVPYVALIGTDEMESGAFALKDMNTGEQQNVDLAELINILKK